MHIILGIHRNGTHMTVLVPVVRDDHQRCNVRSRKLLDFNRITVSDETTATVWICIQKQFNDCRCVLTIDKSGEAV